MIKLLNQAASICCFAGLLAACGSNSDTPQAAHRTLSASASAPAAAVGHSPGEYRELVQQIYLAYLGRPADFLGLQFWMQTFSERGMPFQAADLSAAYVSNAQVRQIIDIFASGSESQALYTGNNQAFVNAAYRNLFNRNAEADGLVFWTGFLERKALTRGQIVLFMLAGAQNDDAVVEKKKVQAALNFTAAVEAHGPATMVSYTGDIPNQAARELLGAIVADTDMDAFQSQIENLVAALPGPLPVVNRYSGYQYQQELSSGPVYSAYYKYLSHGIVPASSGTLTFGIVPQTIDWTRTANAGDFRYNTPVSATVSLAGRGGMPEVAMLCQAVPGGAGTKSTDILVANSLHRVTDARELANQTIGIYREDCALGESSVKSFVFDADGAVTVRMATGVMTYGVDVVNQALDGQALPNFSNSTYFVLSVYRYTRADGQNAFVMIYHEGNSVLGLWSQE